MYPSLDAYTRSIAVVPLSPDVVLIHPASIYPSACVRTTLLASLLRPVCTSRPSSKSAFKLATLVVDVILNGEVPCGVVIVNSVAVTLPGKLVLPLASNSVAVRDSVVNTPLY